MKLTPLLFIATCLAIPIQHLDDPRDGVDASHEENAVMDARGHVLFEYSDADAKAASSIRQGDTERDTDIDISINQSPRADDTSPNKESRQTNNVTSFVKRHIHQVTELALLMLVPISLILVELFERVRLICTPERFPDRGRERARLTGAEREMRAWEKWERERVLSKKCWGASRARFRDCD